MDINGFIKDSLLQIVDSVTETNKELKAKGAYIPTSKITGEGVLFTINKDNTTKNFVKVDFDLAVSVEQGEDGNVGGKISIVPLFNIGSKYNERVVEQSISRVKFTIPLSLPENEK